MSRLNSALAQAVSKKTLQAHESVYLDVDGGIYITNAPFDIEIDGQNYVSVGQFLAFSNIEETRLFTASEITITLAGVPAFETGQSFLSQILEHDYVDREVKIYRSFFSANEYIDSFLMFRGRIDAPVIEDDPADTTTVAATCSSNWRDYERTNGMITNNARQQSLYPGDLGFEFSADVIKDISWKP